MAEEQTVGCVVEALGTIQWPEPREKWNEDQPCARVVTDDGMRYVVSGQHCFRNGTVLTPRVVGRRGTIGVFRCQVVWFNCPTLFEPQS